MKIKKSDYLGFVLITSAKDLKDMLRQICTFGQANYYVDAASVQLCMLILINNVEAIIRKSTSHKD